MAVTRKPGRAAVWVREAREPDHPAVRALLAAAYRQYEPAMPPGGLEYALGVDPALRGRGIGRRLVRECLDRARLLGVPVLCLHTAAFMTAAVALYEAMGFERAPTYD